MIVAASGPLALLVTGGAAGLALALGPGEPLRDGLFKLALLSYGTALFYLNPLVELDGYALLTEWMEQPELRQRSFGAVRERLSRRSLKEREASELRYGRGLALFGVLAVVWCTYTALGGVYLIGYRIVAGLEELLRHPDPTVRTASAIGTSLLGAVGAVLVAAALMRLLRRVYRWASQHGLLFRPSTLLGMSVGLSLVLGLGALFGPLEEADFRALVTPPLVLLTLYYASRLSRDYAPAPGRWLFAALAAWAIVQFVAEETALARAVLPVEAAWPRQATAVAALAGVALLVAFALWVAPAWNSRYRAADSLLLVGLAGYALHPLAGEQRLAAVLATTASCMLGAGTAIHWALRQRVDPPAMVQPAIAVEDSARLAEAFDSIIEQLIADVRSHVGVEAMDRAVERTNSLIQRAGWTIRFDQGGLVEPPTGALLESAPIFRQALVLFLGACARLLGRPLTERLLGQHRELLPWDRREVLDAWVLRDLGWWRGQESPVPSSATVEPFLRRVPLFARLDEAGLRAIASALRSERVPAGRVVIRQGEPGQSFYLLRSGAAEVWQRGESGPNRLLARLSEGDAFGELALLYDQPRNATIRAVTPLELLVMDRPDFDRLVRERYAVVSRIGGELERERLLADLPLLADLAPSELSRLADKLEPVTFPAGEAVVRQGEPGDALYLVCEGRLRVVVSVDGQERELARLGPGEYFGEMALLYDQPRSATVTCVEPTRLYRLRKADFDWLLSEAAAAGHELERVSSRRRRVELESAARAQFSL